uniref:antiviral RADAR system adenosine deaminase RdrB n=1 Tax=Alcaligenes faecalis TaxID=511 RepID=UPI003D008E42
MLKRSLYEMAVGALLGGPEMANLLVRQLQRKEQNRSITGQLTDISLVGTYRKALETDLDARWPHQFRLNELESIATQICKDSFLVGPELPVLDALFNELMEVDGELICFRTPHVQAYIRMSAEIEPAAIVGWHLAGIAINTAGADIRRFERMVSLQSSFFAPRSFEHRPVAENHAHIGGTFGDGAVLSNLILAVADKELSQALSKQSFPEDRSVLERVKRARNLINTFLKIWRQAVFDVQPEDIPQQLERAGSPETLLSPAPVQVHWSTFVETIDVGPYIDSRWLVMALSQAMLAGDLETAWLWLYVALWCNYRTPDASIQERIAVLSVINELNLLRRRLVMDGRGLRRFTQRYYNPSMRGLARNSAVQKVALNQDVARRVFVQASDQAELKVAPSGFTPKMVKALAFAIDGHKDDPMRGLLPPACNGSREQFRRAREATFDRWHLCVHFSRRGDAGRTQRRAKLWDEAKELLRVSSSHSLWHSAGLMGGDEHKDYHFEPGHFLRGLDVAGDETQWPIEVFAPGLRWLRKTHLSQGNAKGPVLRPHLSIHAGEDYAHALSGIRHTDETVRFCEMTKGDRLGHALAIGIRPQQWFARHGEVLLDVDEHFDNLVWAWDTATRLASRLPLAGQVLPRLEQRIHRFLRYVTWMQPAQSPLMPQSVNHLPTPSFAPTLRDLHNAWALRRNCSHLILHEDPRMPLIDTRMKEGAPDHERLFAERNNPHSDLPAMLYLMRAQFEREHPTHSGLKVLIKARPEEKRYQQSLAQQPATLANLLHDHEEQEDIEFMEAAQDQLLDEYEQLGIVIEANPTSNVYIGPLHDYREHPLLRWNPPNPEHLAQYGPCNRFGLRRGSIPVTINTDDQGIMPTTLRTELHLMREAAIDLGASGAQADTWIDMIRIEGLEQFRRNHYPVFERR